MRQSRRRGSAYRAARWQPPRPGVAGSTTSIGADAEQVEKLGKRNEHRLATRYEQYLQGSRRFHGLTVLVRGDCEKCASVMLECRRDVSRQRDRLSEVYLASRRCSALSGPAHCGICRPDTTCRAGRSDSNGDRDHFADRPGRCARGSLVRLCRRQAETSGPAYRVWLAPTVTLQASAGGVSGTRQIGPGRHGKFGPPSTPHKC